MDTLTLGLLQGNFLSAFDEPRAELREVARLQSKMTREDFQQNQSLLLHLIRQAADEGAQLVLSPESYLDGWSACWDIVRQMATTIPGPETDELCDLAKERNIWICVGMFERVNGKIYNAAILISAEGIVVGVYRKTHETPSVLEQMPYSLGDTLSVYETPWGKAGMLVCHDRWYPENARTLALQGAKFVLNPVATSIFAPGHTYYDVHRCVLRTQAYINGLFWISCNSANHGGNSLAIDAQGAIITEASGKEEVLLTTLDFTREERYEFLQNLRADIYFNRPGKVDI